MTTDVLVIGGGIAGVSIASDLAADHAVTLLEMESTLAFHTTGRSAATYIESYGNAPVRALTAASRDDLMEFASERAVLYVGSEGSSDAVRALFDEVRELTPSVELIAPDATEARNPLLRQGYTELAMVDPSALDIDVHALHQRYVRKLRARGGTIVTSAPVIRAYRETARWSVTTADGNTYGAPIVVNAAGAWCDRIAHLFGAEPIGITPLRRTAFMVAAPDGSADLPLTVDIDDRFYFKPEGTQLLCSPSDETPQDPGDARPDDTEIARAIDALRTATTLDIRHVPHKWAGLRNFTADRTPVAGFASDVAGFFWLAGQGGYGIQTAPALARAGAALVRGHSLPTDIAVHTGQLAPGRAAG